MNDQWMNAFGEGWAGKFVYGLVALLGGWLLRRPADVVTIRAQVTKDFQALVAGYEKRLKRADERCDAAERRVDVIDAKLLREREECDAKLAGMRAEIDALMNIPPAPDYTELKRPIP